MKRVWFVIVWICIIIAGFFAWRELFVPTKVPNFISIIPTPTPQIVQTTTSQYALFVPYWSVSTTAQTDSKYTTILYFGIAATTTGIDTNDEGYKNISMFSSMVGRLQKKILIVRMLDSSENTKILNSTMTQQKVVAQSIQIAKENGFSGVGLDLEMQSLPFNTIVSQIDTLFDTFSQQAKQNNLTFDATMYGDVFYRPRPFDVQYLAKDVDHIYIMAYDLHKAAGVAGPNFPLKAASDEYDLQKMLGDYKAAVPVQKLIVVFGMFGYDWTIDEQGQTVGTADSLSDAQIQQKFFPQCLEIDCTITRDTSSAETVIHYTDSKGQKHIVWFEDPASSERKQTYLQQQGIGAVGYWAYSYF